MSYRTLFPLAVAAAIVVSTVNGQGGGTGGNPGGGGGGMVGGSGVRSSSPALRGGCCGVEGSYIKHRDGTDEWGQKGTNRAPLGCITDPSLSEGGSGMLADGGAGADDACCDTGASGGGAGECSDCRGGNAPGKSGGILPDVDFGLNRRFLPHNQAVYSSFGPGTFLFYDKKFYVYPHPEAGNAIQLFDFISGAVYEMVDGVGTEPFDGVFHDERNKVMKSLTLLDGGGLPTTDLSLAATAKLEDWRGATTEFSIFDLSTDPLEPDYTGRMTKITDRNGYQLTISYRDSLAPGSGGFTAQELIDSPDRRYQIYQVVDYQGDTATFEYGTTQVGGRWALSRVILPDATDVDYEYTNDRLTKVVYANGSEATYVYGQDPIAQTVTVQVYEPRSGKAQKKLHLTNDYITLGTDVINQPQGVLRMVEDDNNEVMLMLIPDDLIPNQFLIYKGDSLAGEIVPAVSTQMYEDGWEFDPQQVGEINGTLEGTYESSVGATTEQLYQGTVPQYADATGRTYSWEYDGDTFPTKKTFDGDSTYEELSYTAEKKVARFRDRLGRVTQYEYDSDGNRTKTKTGILEVGGQDVNQPEYAEQINEYYPSTHVSKGLLKTAFSPLHDGMSADVHRTDYEYDGRGNVTKILESAATAGADRPEWTFTYDTKDRKTSQTDPMGHTVNFEYDDADRVIRTTYDDGSTEETLYGAAGSGQEHLVLKTKNRRDVVTSYTYDTSGRQTQVTVASATDADILDGQSDDNPISDRNSKSIRTYSYLDGTALPISVAVDGSTTDTIWDYRHRPIEQITYPHANKSLHVKNTFVDNDLFSTEDPYGRFTYFGYRASDGALIRYVTGAFTTFSLADEAALFALNRDLSLNAPFVIKDALKNDAGQLDLVIDGRGIQYKTEYDSAGRAVRQLAALGTPVEAKTETDYNDAGNAVEIRSPRYFDSSDVNGFQKCKTVMTYDGRGNLASRAEAPGTPEGATESYTYTLDNRQAVRTDFRGFDWATIYASCCGQSRTTKDPYGHGEITNSDPGGIPTHAASVKDADTHLSLDDPLDAKTLREATTRFDALGRRMANSLWLTPQGAIDPDSVPIAGLDGVPSADGLTTQVYYDADLSDGVGLDSTAGLTVSKLGGGTYSVTLAGALAKLAEPESTGGAGIVFDPDAAGSAYLQVDEEEELAFVISDSTSAMVMSGRIHPHFSSTPNAMISWTLAILDGVSAHTTYGDLHEKRVYDAAGYFTATRLDGAGRLLEYANQDGAVSAFEYDGNGNRTSLRDANSVGIDAVYDELNRQVSSTDTSGDGSQLVRDKSGAVITRTNGKGNSAQDEYDARGRLVKGGDYRGKSREWTYNETGSPLSYSDEDGSLWRYEVGDAGEHLATEFPGHQSGTSVGDPGFARAEQAYDCMGRPVLSTDAIGNQVGLVYDLGGRLLEKNYTGYAGGPLAGQTEQDTYAYDRKGRIIRATSGRYANEVRNVYGADGRVESESLVIDGQTYNTTFVYDSTERLTQLGYPDGSSVSYAWTPAGNLSTVVRAGVTLETRQYTNSRLSTRTFGNGLSESFQYSADGLPDTVASGPQSFSYQRDANKDPTTRTVVGGPDPGSTSFAYDLNGSMVARTTPARQEAWALSDAGDWITWTVDGVAESRVHGDMHEITSRDGAALQHDVEGKILSDTVGREYGWGFEGSLDSVEVTGTSVGTPGTHSYRYDALGRRVATKVEISPGTFRVRHQVRTSRLPGGQRDNELSSVLCEYNADGSTPILERLFIPGAQLDDAPVMVDRTALGAAPATQDELYYLHRDPNNSVVGLSDDNGVSAEFASYTAYGAPELKDGSGAPLTGSQVENRHLFGSMLFDTETGLYHARTRYLDPSLGRFIKRDAKFKGDYVYGNNSPERFRDPTGYAPCQARCNALPIAVTIGECKTRPKAGVAGITMWGATFNVGAVFREPNCHCCEYRQFVKTEYIGYRILGDGTNPDFKSWCQRMIEEFRKRHREWVEGNQVGPEPKFPHNDCRDYWREDCANYPKRDRCFGRKGEGHHGQYTEDGCGFNSKDSPGIPLNGIAEELPLLRNARLEVVYRVFFDLQIIDVCNGGAIKRQRQINISCPRVWTRKELEALGVLK